MAGWLDCQSGHQGWRTESRHGSSLRATGVGHGVRLFDEAHATSGAGDGRYLPMDHHATQPAFGQVLGWRHVGDGGETPQRRP